MLSLCAALAAGEYLASRVSVAADVWPLAALAVVLSLLLGYGLSARGWPLLTVFFLGAALYFLAARGDEQLFRERPWLRGCPKRTCRDPMPGVPFRGLRRECSRRIAVGLSAECPTVGLSRAILLGERRGISPEVKRIFVESGALHVFAISGLHVMAIADVLAFLLTALMVPRRLVGLVAVPLLWGYVLLIGAPPSAVRAALMATFSCLGPLFWRKADGVRAWSLAFLSVHLLCPRLIVDVGNALSFAVMLAIVLVGEATCAWAKWKRTLATTVAAWAVGVPIAAHVFGRITPGGILANLVLLSAAKLAVVSGSVGILSSCLSETLAAHFNNLSSLAIGGMVLVSACVSRLPGANVETGCWSLLACVEWYAVCGLAVLLAVCRASRRAV